MQFGGFAVREENAMHGRTRHTSQQDREEPHRVFGVRIKEQAGVFKSAV